MTLGTIILIILIVLLIGSLPTWDIAADGDIIQAAGSVCCS
jgi:hypothetical protein